MIVVNKNNKLKMVVMMAIAMMLIWAFAVVSYAGDKCHSRIRHLRVENGKCIVMLEHDAGKDFIPEIGKSQVALSGKDCEITDIRTYAQERVPVLYDCIVDVSGSVKEDQLKTTREIISEIVARMSSEDMIRITKVANNCDSSEFLKVSEMDQITEIINGIHTTSEDTNLYYSIQEELKTLKAKEDMIPERKCLLIFSDGVDEQDTGITLEEVQDEIKASTFPVFTVATLRTSPTEAQVNASKVLSSFARNTMEGLAFVPVLDKEKKTNQEIVDDICGVMLDGLIITFDCNGFGVQSDVYNMKLMISDGQKDVPVDQDLDLNTSLAITNGQEYDMQIQAAWSENLEEEKNDAEIKSIDLSETEEQETEKSNNSAVEYFRKNPVMLYVVIGAIVLIIVLIVLIIVMASGSKKTSSTVPTLILTPRNGKGRVLNIKLKKRMTMGRADNCDVPVPEDDSLSGTHCSFWVSNGSIYIADENSTNGTYINGNPIMKDTAIYPGCVLLIGGYEYMTEIR